MHLPHITQHFASPDNSPPGGRPGRKRAWRQGNLAPHSAVSTLQRRKAHTGTHRTPATCHARVDAVGGDVESVGKAEEEDGVDGEELAPPRPGVSAQEPTGIHMYTRICGGHARLPCGCRAGASA
eukprot:3583720-Rhodomonas_salina.5